MPESSVQEVQKPQGQPSVDRAPGEPSRDIGEVWREFKDRVQVRANEGAREHMDPAKRAPEQSEKHKETGEEKPAAEGKGDVKSATEGEGDKAATTGEQKSRPQTGYDRLLERASKEPDFEKVVERLHEPFFPLSREGNGRYQVMAYALKETINPDDVIYFLSRPENSSVALKMQDASPPAIAKMIHMISAELRFGKHTTKSAEEEPRQRSKPPAEVGGRGTATADRAKAAARNGDFSAFEEEMNRRTKATER